MLSVIRLLGVVLVTIALAGCSDVNYDRTQKGKLAGKLILEWIDQDKFRFISDSTNPLRFVRANNEVIKPGAMFTDGGSIPGPLRAIKSFSPWGYAPAFIIHDWLFVMNHCKIDGFKKWDHLKAAEVFSEVMKTVMENPKFGGPNKLVHYSMYEAVRSDIAKDYWEKGTCETPGGQTRALNLPAKADNPAPASSSDSETGQPRTRSISPPGRTITTTRARRYVAPARMRTVITY